MAKKPKEDKKAGDKLKPNKPKPTFTLTHPVTPSGRIARERATKAKTKEINIKTSVDVRKAFVITQKEKIKKDKAKGKKK